MLKKVIEGDEKNKQKNITGFFFLFPEMNLIFFGMFYPNFFFSKIGRNLMRALGRKKTHVFYLVIARPKSNARAHLKKRKKNIVALATNI